MNLHSIYFWTDTVRDWNNLLDNNTHKKIIIDCWRELIKRDMIAIYGFVIMPNHIHVIWEMLQMNGKEMPYASLNSQATCFSTIKVK
ncbi:MAG: hypothetical protein JST46_17475 [Bacteroidetes bacterium]|nr:hypothetical protein [Bacteroidota bacterium]